MKCARCGYFNLPGGDICGRCGSSLASSADTTAIGAQAAVPFQEIYPPRARSRAPFAPVAERMRLRTAPARRRAEAAARAIVIPEWRAWTATTFSVAPGLTQLWQARTRNGAPMLIALVVLVSGLIASFRQPFADVFLWLLGILSVYSVWDTANANFETTNAAAAQNALRAHRLRALRLLLLAVTNVSLTVATIYGILARWYTFSTVQTDQSAPLLRSGDVILGRLAASSKAVSLRRGDVILYGLQADLPAGVEFAGSGSDIERIIGLPGDVVGAQRGAILVNGAALSPARMPLTTRTVPTEFSLTVPAGDVLVWRGFTLQGRADAAPPAQPYLLVPREQVQAAVIAICEPPTRRRWFP